MLRSGLLHFYSVFFPPFLTDPVDNCVERSGFSQTRLEYKCWGSPLYFFLAHVKKQLINVAEIIPEMMQRVKNNLSFNIFAQTAFWVLIFFKQTSECQAFS